MGDALNLCHALVADGVTMVIATPHQLGSYSNENSASRVRAAVAELNEALADHEIPLDIIAGGDVRMDDLLLERLDADEILTLGDRRRYILLELPHDALINPIPLLRALRVRGITAIISHPERHRAIIRRPETVVPWIEAGAYLQLTSGSLVGDFGAGACETAWRLLVAGFTAFVASDAHGKQRPPRMTDAIAAISRRLGHVAARRVCIENPLCVAEGRELIGSRFGKTLSISGAMR